MKKGDIMFKKRNSKGKIIMNKKVKWVICILTVVAAAFFSFVSCNDHKDNNDEKENVTQNIKVNTAFVASDGSVPMMNIDSCEALLSNPDRGLRMEAYITLGETPDTYPLSGEDPFVKTQEVIDNYKQDKPTLCQLYVYLSNYRNKDLDDKAFSLLSEILGLFKDNGIRVLLRFAYSTESVKDAPYRVVKRHLEQIDEYFKGNEELINDTLYCLQTGIIGYWGEGHSNKKLKNRYIDDVIGLVCDIAPEGIYTQVRTYDMLCMVEGENKRKVGIHDDYIIGDLSHKWAFLPNTSEEYERTMENARFTINDGEMPWGRATMDDLPDGEPLNSLDGKAILKQLSTYSLTSFSLEHNYRENGKENSMAKWKNEYLTYSEVLDLGIKANPELFKDSKGNEVSLSVYDIIRYHLGYQLLLSNYKEGEGEVSFSVTNYGFAPPLNFNYFALVMKNKETGEIEEKEISDYDKNLLLSATSVSYTVELPKEYECLGVKMDTFKGRGVNVRFANSTDYIDGVQYFK